MSPLLGLGTLVACRNRSDGQTPATQPMQGGVKVLEDADAYAVYSAVLSLGRSKRVVVEQKTEASGLDPKKCLQPELLSLLTLKPLIDALAEANKTDWLLQPKFSASRPVDLLTEAQSKVIFKDGPNGWPAFAAAFPEAGHSKITFSPIGFNAGKSLALLYSWIGCGGLCGAGHFQLLERKPSGWSVIPWKGSITCAVMS
jgi:hypothetical protein